MGQGTGISWCDHTFNPWWGCVKVSPACTNCYAERDSKRYGFKVWGPESERRFFGRAHWAEPYRWNKLAERRGVRRRVFCASMADVCEDHEDLRIQDMLNGARRELARVIDDTPMLDWLLLTKRIEHFTEVMPVELFTGHEYPRNIMPGTTVENQEWARRRIPALLKIPLPSFVSYEPALGALDLAEFPLWSGVRLVDGERWVGTGGRIAWVIAGGESGPHARPSHPDWFRSVRDQCLAAGVAFHFKQWGEWQNGSAPPKNLGHIVMNDGEHHVSSAEFPRYTELEWAAKQPTVIARVGKKAAGRLLDGREWNEFPEVRP